MTHPLIQMLHCVALSLQRRLRDSFRLGLPARWLVIWACSTASGSSWRGFLFVTYLLHTRNFVVSNSPE
jgi:hypothetical protein